MEPEELVARHPRLFHVAAAESWTSIRRHGLLSAERLLRLHDVDPSTRARLLGEPRRRTHLLDDPDLGVAWIRDQKPLKFIERRLEPGVTLEAFLAALNSRVFFHPTPERLDRLLGAKEYRGTPQVVLTVDTARLLERHGDVVTLCRFNSGACMHLTHPVRGPGSWLPVADYPYDDYVRRFASALAEVTVPDAVPDVLDLVTEIEHVTP